MLGATVVARVWVTLSNTLIPRWFLPSALKPSIHSIKAEPSSNEDSQPGVELVKEGTVKLGTSKLGLVRGMEVA